MDAAAAKKNFYALSRNCWHCNNEMSDDDFRLKITKVDTNYSIAFGRMFHIPSYVLCSPCKSYMFKIDLIADAIIIICCICLLFNY